MQTARVTVLMTPDKKVELEEVASMLGVSTGEYIRLAVDNYKISDAEEEAELVRVIAELEQAMPAMHASFDRMEASIEESRRSIDTCLRQLGLRQ